MKDLTKGNLVKTFILFAVPLVLSALLSQAYNLMDTVIAGRLIGENALGAIGSTSALITFVSSIFYGYGVGFSIYIARLFGAGEFKKIKEAIITTYLMLAVVGVVISAGLLLFYNQIFDFLKIDNEIRSDAFAYFSVYISGLFIIVLNANGLYILNAFGESSFPFFMSVISAVLNIGGNIVSVTLLDMGLYGIAGASVLSALVVDILYLIKISLCFKQMGIWKDKIKLSTEHLSRSFSYAVPNMVQQMVMYLASLLISPLVNGIGSAASAGYTVVMKIFNVNAAIYQNSSETLSNYTAQCVGAKKTDKLGKALAISILQGTMFIIIPVLVCALFPNQVCSIFFKEDATPEAIGYAVKFAQVFLPFIVLNLVCNNFHALFRGVKAMRILFISTFFAAAVRYAVTAFLSPRIGMDGVYYGYLISWICELVLASAVYVSGKWKPRLDDF